MSNGSTRTPKDDSSLITERLVRYRDLRPCTTAFIDTRTPGSAEKENFTIIGPGVAENPDQHVHIEIPHGFNVGGARQPPGCVNSQHSHETAEVFVVHSGTWEFILGPNAQGGRVTLRPGDTISIPVNVFRGFENVGEDVGFLFAVLGGDDPGRVTWAPYVFAQARAHGLVLLEDGSLVDTRAGETIPPGKHPMPPTTEEQAAGMNRLSGDQLAACVVVRPALDAVEVDTPVGYQEAPIIGGASDPEGLPAGALDWLHGFHVRRMTLAAGAQSLRHVRHEEEVLMVHAGALAVTVGETRVELAAGDVLTVPVEAPRQFSNAGGERCEVYVVRGSDQPAPAAL